MSLPSRRLATAALLAALVPFAGCDRTPTPAAPPRTQIVFATLYPLADIARQVGGDLVKVDWLFDLGDPLDRYALDAADRVRMAGADLILCDGAGRTETWALRELDRIRETDALVPVDQTKDAWQAPPGGLLVLDPTLAGQYAYNLAAALNRRVPSRGGQFRQNADAFVAKIDAAVASFRAPPDAQAVVLTNTFSPMLIRLGVRPVYYGADVLHLTPADADAIRRTADAAGVRTVLVGFDTPPGTLARLEQLTGLKPFTLDPMGYPNYGQHGSYLDVLTYNLDQLRLATSW